MKKQGDFYLRIISISLALVIAAYVLFSVLLNAGSSYSLEPALYCEAGDGVSVSGFVVRQEFALTARSPLVVAECAEGEWVGGGQLVAAGYRTEAERQSRAEQARLQWQSEQLALAGQTDAAGRKHLDQQISETLVALSRGVAAGDADAVSASGAALSPLILRRCAAGEGEALRQRAEELAQQAAALEQTQPALNEALLAPQAGYFSSHVDGYESLLTPEQLDGLTAGELERLSALSVGGLPEQYGKLCLGQTWYFVAALPAERAAQCAEGDRLTVRLSGVRELRMQVRRVGDEENGLRVLVLSSSQYLQEVTALRKQHAELIFQTYEGLRVPKKALYVENGETGVYVLEGARAQWKPVEVLFEQDDSFLVAWERDSVDNLWPEDELILTSKEITDGKVLQE